MALGGGTFTTQNKVFPGAYINFISKSRTVATSSDRGIAAVPVSLDWGESRKAFTLTQEEFQSYSLKYLGFSYTSEKAEAARLRDLFINTQTAYLYNINELTAASSGIGTAKYGGAFGNGIKVVCELETSGGATVKTYVNISEDEDEASYYLVDSQTITDTSSTSLDDNDYVVWTDGVTLTENIWYFTGGATTEADDTSLGAVLQDFLTAIEGYYFNVLVCPSSDSTIKSLFINYTKRMRDDEGVKFQTVVYAEEGADYEGIISVKNAADTDTEYDLVYWVGGATAGAAVNESLLNAKYDGEFGIVCGYSKTEYKQFLSLGYFCFYEDEPGEYRVLRDINTFISITTNKTADFSLNQVVRVMDDLSYSIARTFNNYYLGKVQNNGTGRAAFKAEIIDYCGELQGLGAIEEFNSSEDVTVTKGEEKGDVVAELYIEPVAAMEKLYMVCVIE